MEKKNNLKTQVYNLVILDKSGSMEDIRLEAISGYNETLGTIRAAQLKHIETQMHYVSLCVFCSCGINMIYDKIPITEVKKLTRRQYDPCCGTPLYDAIGYSIKKLRNDIKDVEDAAVLVTIITDGYENSSKEWDGPTIKKLIDECIDDGWMISFIGAGEDIVKVATTISITNTMVWEQTSEGTAAAFGCENNAQTRFYDRMAEPCCAGASVEDRKRMRRQFSEEYYDED